MKLIRHKIILTNNFPHLIREFKINLALLPDVNVIKTYASGMIIVEASEEDAKRIRNMVNVETIHSEKN